MKMAIVLAGFSPGEADRLRKVMGFKRANEEMDALMHKMVRGMEEEGIETAVATQIRDQLRGFAAYGFPESHAASFALIVYASAWLKHHHPGAFYAGLLNCQPMGFYSPSTLIGDARRHDVVVLPVCVNHSAWRWTMTDSRLLRAGLLQLRGFGEAECRAIVSEREQGGTFSSVDDFCDRMLLSRRHLRTLAYAGAFSCFEVSRREALWQVQGWRRRLPLEAPQRQIQLPGFPALGASQENLLDHSTTGFSPREHPLAHVRIELTSRGYIQSSRMSEWRDRDSVSVAGLVITRQRPETAKGTFFITLEDETGFANLIVQKKLYERKRRLLRRVRFLGCTGQLQLRDGVVNLLAVSFEDLEQADLMASPGSESPKALWSSRDFR